MKWLLAVIAISLLAFPAKLQALPAVENENACLKCHSFMRGELAQPVSEWQGSIHQIEGISCELCHGGNEDLTLGNLPILSISEFRSLSKQSMYAVADFKGAPSGQAQFDLCAHCHPDSVKTYAASIMGQAYLQAKGGPSCTRCHGAHRNIMPRVPEVCEGCHQDTTGFGRIPAMSITEAQVEELADIRIQLGMAKVTGRRPFFKRHLESFTVGLIVWSMILVLFFVAIGLHRLMKGGDKL